MASLHVLKNDIKLCGTINFKVSKSIYQTKTLYNIVLSVRHLKLNIIRSIP